MVQRLKAERAVRYGFLVIFFSTAAFLPVVFPIAWPDWIRDFGMGQYVLYLPFFIPLFVVTIALAQILLPPISECEQLMAQVMEESKDPHLVLYLLQQSAVKGDPPMYVFPHDGRVLSVLHRLLPLVTPEVSGAWKNQDRKRLRLFVDMPYIHPQLTLEALRIFSYTADEEDLKEIRFLRERVPWTKEVKAEVRERMLQATVSCEEAVAKRLATLAVSTVLLRASDQPTVSDGKELLRAATSLSESPSSELLRPVDEEWKDQTLAIPGS